MRTYDKQIETIFAGQGIGSLRSSFGSRSAAVVRTAAPVALLQDTA